MGEGRRGVSWKASALLSSRIGLGAECGRSRACRASGEAAGGISDGLAPGAESSAARNPAAGRALISAVRRLSRTKSCTSDLLPEAHLGLGRMHVHIHLFRRHLQKQQHHRKAGGRNHVAIGLGDGVQQQPVADQPLVDEDVDRVAVELLQLGLGVEAAQAQMCRARAAARRGPASRAAARAGRRAPAAASAATGSSCASVSLPKIW